MNKNLCPKCNRILQQSTHNNCMYCGEENPKQLRLNQSEKNKLEKETEEIFLKMEKSNSSSSRNNLSSSRPFDTGFDIGSNF